MHIRLAYSPHYPNGVGINDLDISSTLVETWKDVADICAPLSKLDVLRLKYVLEDCCRHPMAFG